MKRLIVLLLILCGFVAMSQNRAFPVVVDKDAASAEYYAAQELGSFLQRGGLMVSERQQGEGNIYVGNSNYLRRHYAKEMALLKDDGYLICGDGKNICLCGKGEKGTLYAVYAFLEKMGFRLYTPDALVIPDLSNNFSFSTFHFSITDNPAFGYREVAYYYPNHSQLYADWHHLHTQSDRNRLFGMYVHTFGKLLPASEYYDRHPEWYSLNDGRRSRDGQLCLSNPDVLEALCQRLADTMSRRPEARIWSVSPNDNYNACQCDGCRRLDSLYGGQAGTLIWFVNQVARRFPDKVISTLAYQYTRSAGNVRPESNVQVMLCPIESGRQVPIPQSDPGFSKDIRDWHRLIAASANSQPKAAWCALGSADNTFESINGSEQLFIWDYVVQFRNFWNPFPNLHVLQPNLQFFKENGADMMFEQGTGADNVTSWMDIRCYMIAKLLWNPYIDIDSVMDDFYNGCYGDAAPYVKEIIDTMTAALIESGQTLNIYGYPVDAVDGHLSPGRMDYYYSLMQKAYVLADSNVSERLRFFEMAMDFASVELKAHDMYGDFEAEEMKAMIDSLTASMEHFGVKMMMEMGISPEEYGAVMRHWVEKTFSRSKAWKRPVALRKPSTEPYGKASLTDGEGGLLDYRHRWLGFWGDTLDAVVDLGEPQVVSEISVDFYFYPLSWIFLPQRVMFAVSNDGDHWEWRYSTTNENPEVLATPEIYTCKSERVCAIGEPEKYRYVRVVAEPLPEIPAWHRAAGQKPWIFTDEIIIK